MARFGVGLRSGLKSELVEALTSKAGLLRINYTLSINFT